MSLKDEHKIKEGYLNKKGGRRRNWSRRFFVLTPRLLAYYNKKPPVSSFLKGTIHINSIDSVFLDQEDPTIFKILTGSRLYFLRAITPEEASSWLQTLLNTVGELKLTPISEDPTQKSTNPSIQRVSSLRGVPHTEPLPLSRTVSLNVIDQVTRSLATLKQTIKEKPRPLPEIPKEENKIDVKPKRPVMRNRNSVLSASDSRLSYYSNSFQKMNKSDGRNLATPLNHSVKSTNPIKPRSLASELEDSILALELDSDEEDGVSSKVDNNQIINNNNNNVTTRRFRSNANSQQFNRNLGSQFGNRPISIRNPTNPIDLRLSRASSKEKRQSFTLGQGSQFYSALSDPGLGREPTGPGSSSEIFDDLSYVSRTLDKQLERLSVETEPLFPEFKSFKVRALYDFNGQEEEDLSFKKGDIILVIKKDEGWWTGQYRGRTGIFPENYVQVVNE